MLNIERYNLILELIKNKKNIKLNELAEEMDVSEATVRRDLNFLEEKGKIRRVHGGAVLIENKEEDIIYKKMVFSEEKNKIGKEAASHVKNGDIIFLDAGSTAECMIKYLEDKKDIKVVTNGFTHMEELAKFGIETYLIGGKVKIKTGATVGATAVMALKSYNFDISFIGANGITLDGYSTPDPEEVIVKSEAIKRGKEVYFICDESKFKANSFINFASLDEGVLITNGKIPTELEKSMRKKED